MSAVTPEGLPLTVTVEKECDVCVGTGEYLIVDRYGSDRFYIKCPECIGIGKVDEEIDNPDLPPRSTAAAISSMVSLRLYVDRERGR